MRRSLRGLLGWGAISLFIVSCLCCPSHATAVVFGQVDDFQSGTALDWREGLVSPNPPENVATGGPRGGGDGFLRNVSTGSFGAGGRQIMFNKAQWTGDYNAAGVARVSGWFANFGATPLLIRLALEGSFTRFGSTDAFELPADGVWRRASFDLNAEGLSLLSGTAPLAEALSSVVELRVLSAGGPSYIGGVVAATLGVDNLRAMRPEGDANFDGLVDGSDLRLVRSNLGPGVGRTWHDGDFNFDGRVNAVDLALLRRNLRPPATPGPSIVPEPSALALLALAAAGISLRPARRPHPSRPPL